MKLYLRSTKSILLIVLATIFLAILWGTTFFSASQNVSGNQKSIAPEIENVLGAAPIIFESTAGILQGNNTQAVFLWYSPCRACDENDKNLYISKSYPVWQGNLTSSEVTFSTINYYRKTEVEEAYFKSFKIPESQNGTTFLVVHNSNVGLVYYSPLKDAKIRQGIYYITRGSLERERAAENDDKIHVEFFYSSSCGSCKDYYDEAKAIENNQSYFEDVVFQWKDIATSDEYNNEYKSVYVENYGVYFPFFVVKNQTSTTVISSAQATIEHLESVINDYIEGRHAGTETNKDIVEVNFLAWHIKIDMAAFSLPVLTVVLAGVDSFNPCSFFILIFLLNLLIYAKSKRRMLLIGGTFIFFSGFLYIIFMFVLVATLTVLQTSVLSITVGLITLCIAILNIKDFFFFKNGASVSIPEKKKPGIYKQMRNLVKTPQVATAIIGTVILAATVNFYELLCSLGLPLVYVSRLTSYKLLASEYYMYILFYNVIYVIPLIIILLIFIGTLGHRKLSEWHGRILKLFSGIMLGSFGAIFLIDYSILENIATPILLLLFALVATVIIGYMWKKYRKQ